MGGGDDHAGRGGAIEDNLVKLSVWVLLKGCERGISSVEGDWRGAELRIRLQDQATCLSTHVTLWVGYAGLEHTLSCWLQALTHVLFCISPCHDSGAIDLSTTLTSIQVLHGSLIVSSASSLHLFRLPCLPAPPLTKGTFLPFIPASIRIRTGKLTQDLHIFYLRRHNGALIPESSASSPPHQQI